MPERFEFSEPFASQLRRGLIEMENNKRAREAGQEPPNSNPYRDRKNTGQPPTPAQLRLLKSLGENVMPMSKYEASKMIEGLLAKQRKTK